MGEEEIISLIPLLLQGKATDEQERAVRCWLEENEGHLEIYRKYCAVYYRLYYAGEWKKIDVSRAIKQVKGQNDRKTIVFRKRKLLSGVAALFLICIGAYWLLHSDKQPEVCPQKVVEQINSGEKKAILTLADGKQVELVSGSAVDKDLGIVQVTGDSMAGLVYRAKDTIVKALEYHLLSVPRAGEYVMTLSDGTKVWINAESEIKYPVVFGPDKREVFITGEAFFEVVKDSLRPFIVHTPNAQTTVLGTSFNVMAYPDERHTEITLLKGAVVVEAAGRNQYIKPGQQVQVDNVSKEMNCREVNAGRYASWKDGLFDFEGMKLEDLAVELSRWDDVDFFFIHAASGQKKFTGAIKRNNSLQFMLDFIEKTSDVRFEVKENVVRVYNR